MAAQQNVKQKTNAKKNKNTKKIITNTTNEEAAQSVSGDVDKESNSENNRGVKDLKLALQVDDSSDVLQVDDKSNTVAEKGNCVDKNIGIKAKQEIKMPSNNTTDLKDTKPREEIKAERKAKKAAKLAAKTAKATGVKSNSEKVIDQVDGCIVPIKPSVVPSDILEKCDSQKQSSTVNVNSDDHKSNELKISVPKEAEITGKSKAELRAERRAKQEAQRAAKATQAAQKVGDEQAHHAKDSDVKENDKTTTSTKENEKKEIFVEPKYNVKLFSHLHFEKNLIQDYDYSNLHPAVLQLGAQYETRVISGSNARCLALLHALKRMVSDYSTPLKQEFSRGLESMLVKSMDYLNYCRPSSVSMTNAVRHIKRHLTQLPNTVPDSEARLKLHDIIDTYVREQIDVAGEAICNTVQKKINNGDVILTYGCSSLIFRILVESHRSGTKFSVVVVDGGPWFEGREMLRRLIREGIKCSYILITAASFIMREASKVLLGAHALLANGYVMSRAGTSQVALLAHSYNVPVLVCCETHKFSERVQTDAFVYNELGDPDEFVCKTSRPISSWRSYDYLTPLSIAFDVTPPDLVTAVVTELGILPCTSVPVILRIKPSESV
ncbi:eukaryotic translation initiation factor 2B subunit delta isoform X2 [Lycorma delicatula]|uniref:eukaryotic translation initiation factor 2B subunit delta isoform X2 n=1 Tax=Lycorma delicatula TaxID=130591 RepID=UPI003F50EC3E